MCNNFNLTQLSPPLLQSARDVNSTRSAWNCSNDSLLFACNKLGCFSIMQVFFHEVLMKLEPIFLDTETIFSFFLNSGSRPKVLLSPYFMGFVSPHLLSFF